MIALNEEHCIARALQSVKWADQIVVLDCGSTDDTFNIARKYTNDLEVIENHPNLNINKNKAIDKCTYEWVFILDADEVIPYDLAGEIRRIINEGNSTNGFMVPRRNFVLGKWMKRGSQYPDYQLRLFRKEKGRFPAVHVHERLEVEGQIAELSIPFDHHPYPTLSSMMRKNRRDFEFEAQYLFDQGIRSSGTGTAFRILTSVPVRFFRRYFLKLGFLDGIQGLIVSWFDVANIVQRWFRLWELSKHSQQLDKND